MELGEHPQNFLLRVDRMVKKMERVERPVNPKDIDLVPLSGLTDQYDAKIRTRVRRTGRRETGSSVP